MHLSNRNHNNKNHFTMALTLFDNLPGFYKGNVEHVFANLGRLMKTGYVHINKDTTSLSITCGSRFKSETTEKFPIEEITPFFNEKKVSIQLEDGRTEERVAFRKSRDDSYGFYNKWLGGWSQTITAYQLKFIDQKLIAFRVQQYNTNDPSKINYFLEISHLKKWEPEIIEDEPKSTESAKSSTSGLKTDWDF